MSEGQELPAGAELAYAHALRLIAKRVWFEEALANELERQGFDEVSVQWVLRRLKTRRIVNNRLTIESLLVRFSGKRSIGLIKLKAELEKRGAPNKLVEETLAELDGEWEKAGATQLVNSRSFSSPAQMARFLAGRGFSEPTIEFVLQMSNGP